MNICFPRELNPFLGESTLFLSTLFPKEGALLPGELGLFLEENSLFLKEVALFTRELFLLHVEFVWDWHVVLFCSRKILPKGI
jgi:hypothetical protein